MIPVDEPGAILAPFPRDERVGSPQVAVQQRVGSSYRVDEKRSRVPIAVEIFDPLQESVS